MFDLFIGLILTSIGIIGVLYLLYVVFFRKPQKDGDLSYKEKNNKQELWKTIHLMVSSFNRAEVKLPRFVYHEQTNKRTGKNASVVFLGNDQDGRRMYDVFLDIEDFSGVVGITTGLLLQEHIEQYLQHEGFILHKVDDLQPVLYRGNHA